MWSKFPYRKYHTLLVPHRHVTTLPELETSEFESLRVSLRDISETYKKASELEGSDIPSSQLVFSWRERTDSTQEKQSVSHMHMHIYPAMAVDASLNLDPEAFKIRRELIESRL
jgi:diadenosine tetraphosphate (Ap4A) HIT family hydrolase